MIYLDIGGAGPGLVPSEQARLSPADRGFLYGDGLFETILVCDGEAPLLTWHLQRLAKSCGALGIPCDTDGARRAVLGIARAAGAGEHALRLTVSRGASPRRGYEPSPESLPTLLVTAAPYRRAAGPVTMVTSAITVFPGALTARHKTLSCLEKVMARSESSRAGAGEALLLNLHGRVAEGAASNLFIRRGERWVTPPLSEGCLPGVMRRRVTTLTGASEEALTREDLFRSNGVYLTNALMGCLPVLTLDGEFLPQGGPPPFLDRLFAPVS